MKTKMNASRVFLLTFCLLMMSSLKAADVTKYGFWVGGVEVTSDNYTNITSSAITSGRVKYVPSTNTLTLTNCTIKRTGNYERSIENNSCEGLIVKFVGTNNLSSVNASAVRFETKGTLEVVSGTTTLSSENYEGIYMKDAGLTIIGPGQLIVKSTKDCAIEGNSNSGIGHNKIIFNDGISAIIQGKKGDLVDVDPYFNVDSHGNSIFGSDSNIEVRLKATGNSSYPNYSNNCFPLGGVYSTSNLTTDEDGGRPAVIEPIDELSNMGYGVWSQDIVVSSRWKVLFINEFFPEDKFRSFLRQHFGKDYLTKEEVANCTKLDMSGQGIDFTDSDDGPFYHPIQFTGIKRFDALKTFDCSNNHMKWLKIERSTSLKELNCSNCRLERLDDPGNLTMLNCENNLLGGDDQNPWWDSTSLDCLLSTSLKTLKCGGNNFVKINTNDIDHSKFASLTTLDCSNSTKLTSLDCSNLSLTSLNASGCSQLTSLNCENNALTSLNLSGCSLLTSLDCDNNSLTSLNLSACSQLTSLDCSKNKLGSLSVSGKTNLQTLNCSGNASLTSLNCMNDSKLSTLDCSSCALTSMILTNCSKLSSLKCQSNKFTTLSIKNFKSLKTLDCSSNAKLKTLDCSNNALTSLSVTGNSVLESLDCSNNALTSLSLTNDSKLETLVCSNNKLATLTIYGISKIGLIQCDGNQFTSLSFTGMPSLYEVKCSSNPKLKTLSCYNNPLLAELGVDDCTALQTLECYGNNLSSLDVSTCPALQTLNCYNNKITELFLPEQNSNLQSVSCYSNCISDMEGIVSRLPDRNGSASGSLKAIDPNLSTEQNVITQSQVQTALNNNWKTYQNVNGSWIVYEGSSNGIVTGMEPAVSSAAEDATPLYNLSGQRVDKNYKGVVIRNNKKVRMK